MQITPNSLDINAGPGDWFTGIVYVDTVATSSSPSRVGAAMVYFAPGARTAWHTHPFGQTREPPGWAIWSPDSTKLAAQPPDPLWGALGPRPKRA
jgi:hypothetical protein